MKNLLLSWRKTAGSLVAALVLLVPVVQAGQNGYERERREAQREVAREYWEGRREIRNADSPAERRREIREARREMDRERREGRREMRREYHDRDDSYYQNGYRGRNGSYYRDGYRDRYRDDYRWR